MKLFQLFPGGAGGERGGEEWVGGWMDGGLMEVAVS
jgi:hypothetical protein